jgi:ubiquitin C-terminal hydrolase
MGAVCGKQSAKNARKKKASSQPVIVEQPSLDLVYRRTGPWIGYRNLGNTCYINSGRRR